MCSIKTPESRVDFSAFHSLFTTVLSDHGYIYNSKIGSGGQAVVYLCQSNRDSELYAVKIAKSGDEATVPTELRALQNVWNPHVINIYETFIDSGFRFIVLEYCPGGSLHELLRRGAVPLDDLWVLGHQILEALTACHSVGIAHLDIKPQNILIDKNGRAKLCDFGLAIFDNGELSHQFKGSAAFLAPEILRMVDYDPLKADVWSLGVSLYVTATGVLPWPTAAREFFAGAARGLPENDARIPAELADVLRKMVVPRPEARAPLSELAADFDRHCREIARKMPTRTPSFALQQKAGRRQESDGGAQIRAFRSLREPGRRAVEMSRPRPRVSV
jgi:serine/threonine protein kinase